MKEFVTEARIENLSAVQGFIAREMETRHCPAKLQTQIFLAAEEVFVNIAHYAYNRPAAPGGPRASRPPESGNVVIRVAVCDEVIIEFEDSGKPYNPLAKDDPDITLDAEKREVGGLGIYMVKKIMDAVKYRYEDNKNILMIKKRIA